MSEQPELMRLAARIFAGGIDSLPARERRVVEKALRRETVARPVHRESEAASSFGQRLADRVAAVGGSWGFIGSFALFLVAWAVSNSLLLTHPPDPYPFIFLNLLLSMLAAIQAPIIMMSQNRQASRDRLQAQQDYEVNLKAELEILALHEKMDRVLAQLEKRG